MTERLFTKRVGDIVVTASVVEPAAQPVQNVAIAFQGESERLRLSHEEMLDLRYALDRVIAENDRSAS